MTVISTTPHKRRKKGHGAKKRGPRGRSHAKRIAAEQKWLANGGKEKKELGLQKMQSLPIFHSTLLFIYFNLRGLCPENVLVAYPTDFCAQPPSQASIREIVNEKYNTDFRDAQRLDVDGTLLLQSHGPPDLITPNHPPFIGIRVDKALGKATQAYLLRKFDAVLRAGVPHLLGRDGNRSSTPAWHFGVWSIYRKTPIITRETRPNDPMKQAAINGLLTAIQVVIAPLIGDLLKRYAPKVWVRQQRYVLG
jgi:hypothetical protein